MTPKVRNRKIIHVCNALSRSPFSNYHLIFSLLGIKKYYKRMNYAVSDTNGTSLVTRCGVGTSDHPHSGTTDSLACQNNLANGQMFLSRGREGGI